MNGIENKNGLNNTAGDFISDLNKQQSKCRFVHNKQILIEYIILNVVKTEPINNFQVKNC